MKPGDFKITVETLAAGQPRPYADTIHTFRVFFHHLPFTMRPTKVWEEWPAANNEDLVLPYFRAIYDWVNEGEGDWASPRLKFAKKTGPATWEFSVTEAYTD